MSRLIDADALRAKFREPDDWTNSEKTLVHITDIWAVIDCAPTIVPERKKGKWIPCSERMPEESVDVLTYTEIVGLIEIQTLERDGNGVWRWEDSQGGWQDTSTVTAWMPLPEPYQEEES